MLNYTKPFAQLRTYVYKINEQQGIFSYIIKTCNTRQTQSKGKQIGSYHVGYVENCGREWLEAIGKCCEQFIGLINGLFLHMLRHAGSERMSKISLILHVPMSCLCQ
jgi:hypothetical protein